MRLEQALTHLHEAILIFLLWLFCKFEKLTLFCFPKIQLLHNAKFIDFILDSFPFNNCIFIPYFYSYDQSYGAIVFGLSSCNNILLFGHHHIRSVLSTGHNHRFGDFPITTHNVLHALLHQATLHDFPFLGSIKGCP